MKVNDNRWWSPYPEIDIEQDDFTITIREKEVEIGCSWDYGYGGRGTERVYIDRRKLIELLNLIEKPLDKE
jgi:hypothetical protein